MTNSNSSTADLKAALTIIKALNEGALAAGVWLFVDTDGRLKCHPADNLRKCPNLWAAIVQNSEMMKTWLTAQADQR